MLKTSPETKQKTLQNIFNLKFNIRLRQAYEKQLYIGFFFNVNSE